VAATIAHQIDPNKYCFFLWRSGAMAEHEIIIEKYIHMEALTFAQGLLTFWPWTDLGTCTSTYHSCEVLQNPQIYSHYHLNYCIYTTWATWVAHMIMKTLASACLLLEIRWQKGRQADKMRTCTHSLPIFLVAPSNFLSLPSTQFLKSKFLWRLTVHPWLLASC